MDALSTDTKYIFEEYRLESFKGKWKTLRGFKYCTPSSFAAAGFYYAGSKSNPDNVKCFACRKELNDWEKGDDPWEEHKKRGANCMFVKLKEKPGINTRDFVKLFYEVRRNSIIDLIEEKRKILEEKHNALMKSVKKLEGNK